MTEKKFDSIVTNPETNDANKVQILVEALEKIASSKGYTRLADCCVDKSCHTNLESGSCSFQTGVYYANGDRAAEAEEALTAYRTGNVSHAIQNTENVHNERRIYNEFPNESSPTESDG